MSELKEYGEDLRRRMWSGERRWQAIVDALNWASSQATSPRHTMQSCLARQARLLASLGHRRSPLATQPSAQREA